MPKWFWRWGFEMLLEMLGHHAEVWALALSTYGDYIVTGGAGRSIDPCKDHTGRYTL
jgi:hypothetical protein